MTIFLTGATEHQTLNWNDKLEIQIFNAKNKEISVNGKKYNLESERNKIDAIIDLKSVGNKLKYSDLHIFSNEISKQLTEVKPFRNYKILNWEEINKMNECGIEFGAHSISHPGLSAQDEDVINYEIGEIKKVIEEKTGNIVTSFSYPTGLYTDICVRVVKEKGYYCAVTSHYGFNKKLNLYELERIAIGKHLSFPLFVLNLITPLHKIDRFMFNLYHKLFKPLMSFIH